MTTDLSTQVEASPLEKQLEKFFIVSDYFRSLSEKEQQEEFDQWYRTVNSFLMECFKIMTGVPPSKFGRGGGKGKAKQWKRAIDDID